MLTLRCNRQRFDARALCQPLSARNGPSTASTSFPTRTFFAPPPPPQSPKPSFKRASALSGSTILEQGAAIRKAAFASPLNAASAMSNRQLLGEGDQLSRKVVLITGAASPSGRLLAMKVASYGAKVVVGDEWAAGVDEVVEEIEAGGGVATGLACNAADWESQSRLFRHAIDMYGQLDTVVANASRRRGPQSLLDNSFDEDDEPSKPLLHSLHVDLVGSIYSAKLAFFHFHRNSIPGQKSFIAVGSLGSLVATPSFPLNSIAKHGVLGLCKNLHQDGTLNGISVNFVAPLIPDSPHHVQLASEQPVAIEDVADAIIAASTHGMSGKALFVDEK
ncbi:hypothetical protein JCM5296_006165 [Sporobolomyces johnsonii]